MTSEIQQFIDKLNPKDIGETKIGDYIVAYEGFTDNCFDYLVENGLTIEETEKFLVGEWNKQFGTPIESGWGNEIVTYTEPNILYSIYTANKQADKEINLDIPVKIDVRKLSQIVNPFREPIWIKLDKPITKKEIQQAINNNEVIPSDAPKKYDKFWDKSSREEHIQRIAWLVKNYDENNPLLIDFGIPNFGSKFELSDGNHRLAAAIYLNKSYIWADVSGSIDEIEKYLYKENKQANKPTHPDTIIIQPNEYFQRINEEIKNAPHKDIILNPNLITVTIEDYIGNCTTACDTYYADQMYESIDVSYKPEWKNKVLAINGVAEMFPDGIDSIHISPELLILEESGIEYFFEFSRTGVVYSQPIEIIDDFDTTRNSLKSLDKISYKMADALKGNLKSITKSALKFDINSTLHEGRWRIRNPKDFKQDTFRRWNSWAGVKAPEGIQFLVGDLKKTDKKALQTIRFDKDIWDEKEATIYWNKIKDKPGFNKTWTQADWDKEKKAMTIEENKDRCIIDMQGMNIADSTIVEKQGTLFLNMDALSNRHSDETLSDETRKALLNLRGKYSHVNTSSEKFAETKQAGITIPIELEPLVQEAQKYTNVEDFAESLRNKMPFLSSSASHDAIFNTARDYYSGLTQGMKEGGTWKPLTEIPEWALKEELGFIPKSTLKVYRAGIGNKIKAGDFVSTDRAYAETFLRGGNLIEADLPTKDLRVLGEGRIVGKDRGTGRSGTELIYYPEGTLLPNQLNINLEDFYEQVTKNHKSTKQADTTLFNNPWITVRQDNKGYVYANVPEGVAILPYKTENDKTLYLLRSEQNSVLAPEGSLITVITGRRDKEDKDSEGKDDNWDIQCAIRELEEEAGIVATEDKITLLGEMSTNKHTKQSDILLAIDVTGLEENEPETDGTDDEAQSYNFWVDEKGLRDFIKTSKDSYLSTITNKFFNKDINLNMISMGKIN